MRADGRRAPTLTAAAVATLEGLLGRTASTRNPIRGIGTRAAASSEVGVARKKTSIKNYGRRSVVSFTGLAFQGRVDVSGADLHSAWLVTQSVGLGRGLLSLLRDRSREDENLFKKSRR